MKTFTFKADFTSKLASKLNGKAYSSNSNPYTLGDLTKVSAADGKLLNLLHSTIDSENFDSYREDKDFTPVLVAARNGAFSNLYGPVICRGDEGNLTLHSGGIDIPLIFNKKGELENLPEGFEGTISMEKEEFNGYKDQFVVVITLTFNTEEDESVFVTYTFRVRWENVKDVSEDYKENPKALSMMLLKETDKVVSMMDTKPGKSGPTIKDNQLLVDTYKVVDYSIQAQKKDPSKMSGQLVLEGEKDEDGACLQEYRVEPGSEDTEDLDVVKVWMKQAIMDTLTEKEALAGDKVISAEKPAQLIISSVKPSKNGKGYSVSFGFILDESVNDLDSEVDDDLEALDF
jgi:hypothetical protein